MLLEKKKEAEEETAASRSFKGTACGSCRQSGQSAPSHISHPQMSQRPRPRRGSQEAGCFLVVSQTHRPFSCRAPLHFQPFSGASFLAFIELDFGWIPLPPNSLALTFR
jgi:hypothetical protein